MSSNHKQFPKRNDQNPLNQSVHKQQLPDQILKEQMQQVQKENEESSQKNYFARAGIKQSKHQREFKGETHK